MLFNTLPFALFFVVVYALYLALPHKAQNKMLLVASYFFYGYWDWRFLSLLLLTTGMDYFFGLKIEASQNPRVRKALLILSICLNLGILGFFKYFNFFAGSFSDSMSLLGWEVDQVTLKIVLPVGISFYTFQSMSYVIDVYRRELVPAKSLLDFALYVAFFPQLVAGPIERAAHLLPQVIQPRALEAGKIRKGIVLLLWGLFKKVIVADNMAAIVAPIFAQEGVVNGAQAMIGMYAFAFQIYGDFSGYSDIARGLGKMMGFDIVCNFNLPYFSQNLQEFWRRWHISFSTWLRDYLYIPLGGNRKGEMRTYTNLMITMILGGLWHGAAWTFVVWGMYHGILLCFYRMIRDPLSRWVPFVHSRSAWIGSFVKVVVMFHLICFGWLIFRAHSLSQVILFFEGIFSKWVWDWDTLRYFKQFSFYASSLLIVQIIQYSKQNLSYVYTAPKFVRFSIGTLLTGVVMVSFLVGLPNATEFIYFQF
ncbi:MAG: MBOAT family protein [Candidatus Omnitrophica bacterium]|nr:MBOAT family protein [Candidatus Omnitrophota bacterium]